MQRFLLLLHSVFGAAAGAQIMPSFSPKLSFSHTYIPYSLGELVIPSPNALDPEKHALRAAPITRAETPNGEKYTSVFIPWSKTTKNEGLTVTITDNGDPTSPVPAFEHHLACNASVPADAPLFAFETVDGWAPMTRTWFLDRCSEVWIAANLSCLTGHCFRIGGTTELLLRGVAPDVVAMQGSWKSQAFLGYWRKVDSILPQFISNSFDKSRVQLARSSVDQFRKRYAPTSGS